MAERDLENRPADSSQHPGTGNRVDQAGNSQTQRDKVRSRGWFWSFFRRRHSLPTESQGTAPRPAQESRNKTPWFENYISAETIGLALALRGKFLHLDRIHARAQRVKPVPKDGYTTHTFNNLPRPLPVDDIFFNSRPLIVLRLICRGFIITLGAYADRDSRYW